jgi:DNA mismatch endonuclease (patch repair protein)
VFPGRRICLLVHGCFWHGCSKCVDGTREVKSNSKFWVEKVRVNRQRDERNRKLLEKLGWKVITIWECELGQESRLTNLVNEIRQTPLTQLPLL